MEYSSPTPFRIIKGCTLIRSSDNKWLYGDLHELGDVYIFNAILHTDGKAHWQMGLYDGGKSVSVSPEYTYNKHGVLVFSKLTATLNTGAKNYLKRMS